MKAFFREEKLQAGQPRLELDTLELIPKGDWIQPKEAAAALGINEDTFLLTYCDRDAPRVRIFQRFGRKGGRRVLVDRQDLKRVILQGIVVPA